MAADWSELKLIFYPDPRLRTPAEPVATFDASLRALAERMFNVMREHKGVGLAAPQVGVMQRLFVMNPTGEPADDRVYVNPVLSDMTGTKEAEEGCLSLPEIHVQIRRAARCRLRAQDLAGQPVEVDGEDMLCRVWQHETDHLNGVLILDRMGPGDKIATRRALREMEQSFKARSARTP